MALRCTLLGIGAMRSPRFAPAGLLVQAGRLRVMIDGGPGAVPRVPIDAWLITDAHAELVSALRRLAGRRGLVPEVRAFEEGDLRIRPRPVRHTAHPTFGYDIRLGAARAVWAPEFLVFPRWARGAPLMFAEAAAWSRRIWFTGHVGGHATVGEVCASAARQGVRRLVLAHVGRPTLAALDRGLRPSWGEIGREGRTYRAGPAHRHQREKAGFHGLGERPRACAPGQARSPRTGALPPASRGA